ncbi:MAG: SHOCT domain-containing protein [Chloroflexota bacterium]
MAFFETIILPLLIVAGLGTVAYIYRGKLKGLIGEAEEIPQEIRNMLTRHEAVEECFDLRGCRVYATSKRILVHEGRTIKDFDYTHISSVTSSCRHYRWLAVLGALFIALAVYVATVEATAALVSIGVVLIAGGIIIKSPWVQVNVVGMTYPMRFEGSGQTLDSLMQVIRERRYALPESEQPGRDFVDTVRKLAELRDQGIITQEEFEENKNRLMQTH